MNTAKYDFHNQKFLTYENIGNSDTPEIISPDSPAYFIIPNAHGGVSFSKANVDMCVGDVTESVIPDYTLSDYLREYGDRPTSMGCTVKEHFEKVLRLNIG